MIHSGRGAPEGSLVELRRGDHVIVARVMWRDGARVGLQSDERLPVEEILSLSQSKSLQLVAADGALLERRKYRRFTIDDSRLRGRALEYIGVLVIILSLSFTIFAMAQHALAAPFKQIEAALAD